MARILLLGANGQLGSDIRKVFEGVEGHQVIPLFRDGFDAERFGDVEECLGKVGDFEYVINCISYHRTDECELFPAKTFAINSFAVSELARFCQSKQKTLIHISTDYVFNGEKHKPYTEADCPAPLNVYGNSKCAGEHFIQAHTERYFIFRVSSLFGQAGASGKGGNFVETMIRMAREGKPLKVVADQIMSPTHTLDIARAIGTVITNNMTEYGIYHCSGEGQCSWYEFARYIFKCLNLQADLNPIKTDEYPTKARRPPYSVLDNGKLNVIYRMPDWDKMLTEYLRLKNYI